MDCPDKPEDEKPKVVAEQYRGVFKYLNNLIKLTENKYYETDIHSYNNNDGDWEMASGFKYTVWTEGADLYTKNGKRGTFTEVNTFVEAYGLNNTYTRTTV